MWSEVSSSGSSEGVMVKKYMEWVCGDEVRV